MSWRNGKRRRLGIHRKTNWKRNGNRIAPSNDGGLDGDSCVLDAGTLKICRRLPRGDKVGRPLKIWENKPPRRIDPPLAISRSQFMHGGTRASVKPEQRVSQKGSAAGVCRRTELSARTHIAVRSSSSAKTDVSATYVIGHITVRDPEKWDEYRSRVPATLAPWSAELVLRGTLVAILDGEHPHADVVVIRFPDQEAAAGWHSSAAYQALIPLRQLAADVVLLSYEA